MIGGATIIVWLILIVACHKFDVGALVSFLCGGSLFTKGTATS